MRLLRTLKRLRQDDGSALVLAMVIVVAVGILMGTALSFAGTTLGNTPHLRDLRNQTYYAQGAVDGAINNIRGSSIAGTNINGAPCPTYTPPVLGSGLDSGADGSTQFQVTCTGLDSGNEPGTNAPLFAIQTLGTGNAPQNPNCNNPCPAGINQSTGTNNTLSIDGGIISAGRIWNKGSGGVDMEVEGSVLAVGDCSGFIHTTDPAGLQCNRTQPLNVDPQYAPAVGSSSSLASLIAGSGADPAVTCPNKGHHVAWFSPGYYSEQPGTLLKYSQDNNCNGSEDVWWFKPGFYYFDFTHALLGTKWSIDNLVGGTPVGSWNTQANPSVPWGTACDATPVSSTNSSPQSAGVQFIFGGVSKLVVGNGNHLELCGPDQAQSPGTTQSIALYGLNGNGNQGTSTPAVVTDESEAATAAPTSSPASGFVPASAAQVIDGVPAVATIAANGSASLSYSAFAHVPDGASVTALKFHISRTLSSSANDTFQYFTPNNPAGSAQLAVPNNCSPCDVTVPVPTTGAPWQEINGLTLTYTANAGKNAAAVDNLDGISLLVSYVKPALEVLNIGSNYFFDGSDPHMSALLHGTYYTPSVGLDVEGQQNGQVIFSRGVIVSTLLVDSNPSFTQTAAPFQVPGVTSARLVQFIGQVRPNSSSSWTSVVQACVRYNDNNSSGSPGPALPGYTLTVKDWTVLRSSSTQAPPCA